MKTIVLNHTQILQKLNRIAYEILENNQDVNKLILIGIRGNGFTLAKELASILTKITNQEIETGEVVLQKSNPLAADISLIVENESFENATLILIDDVLNSGITMQYALTKLLSFKVNSIKTVALVDRKHRKFPIRCDYVGLTLSTTLQDRIEVELNSENSVAYLV